MKKAAKSQADALPPLTDLTLRIFAMPHDANFYGDIFGGWLVSVMDLAGLSLAIRTSQKRVATVSIEKLSFLQPVFIGDEVSCFAKVVKIGRTSMQVKVETWAEGPKMRSPHKVTEGVFTYVALSKSGKPTPIPASNPKK